MSHKENYGFEGMNWAADGSTGESANETVLERARRLQKEILERLRQLDLKDSGPILELFGDAIETYRDEHNGYVPREVFQETLRIGGKDNCAEVVVRQVDQDGAVTGYWLKERGGDELGWDKQYQVVGCSLTENEGDEESIKVRLAKEVFGVADPTRLAGAKRLGQTLHSEADAGRARACRTEVFSIDIQSAYELTNYGEGWKFFKLDELDESVVDHHHNTLAWAHDENRTMNVDLRNGYVPTKQFNVIFRVYVGAQNQGTERHIPIWATDAQEARSKASKIANLPEYCRGNGRDDLWSYEVDSVQELLPKDSGVDRAIHTHLEVETGVVLDHDRSLSDDGSIQG